MEGRILGVVSPEGGYFNFRPAESTVWGGGFLLLFSLSMRRSLIIAQPEATGRYSALDYHPTVSLNREKA